MTSDHLSSEKKPFRHIVFFKFSENVTEERVSEVERAFAELPTKIETIRDYEWGISESVEGKNDGFSHCFYLTFEDRAGLEFYLPHKAHLEFKKLLDGIIEKAMVFDYTALPGMPNRPILR